MNRRTLLRGVATGLFGAPALLHVAGCQDLHDTADSLNPLPESWLAEDYDPYHPLPVSTASLRTISPSPLRAEPDPALLVDSYLTPVDRFYVHNHGQTPQVDGGSYHLSIEGLVERPLSLTLGDLRHRYPSKRVTATMVCPACRRRDMAHIKPVTGEPWGVAGIGNARWRGVRLADLLRDARPRFSATHVWLEGLELAPTPDGRSEPFAMSIPLQKAVRDTAGSPVLAAYEMNGLPLSVDQGYPVRAVVPGYIDAYSVKWLSRVVLADRPLDNYFMNTLYRAAADDTAPGLTPTPLTTYTVNSAICNLDGENKTNAGETVLRGWALPGGTEPGVVNYVFVSADGGQTWRRARFTSPSRAYAWQLWEAPVPVALHMDEIVVRAGDSTGATQPATGVWNSGGYLYNGWHRVKPDVKINPLGLDRPA